MEEENTQQRPSAAEKAAEVEEAYRKGEEKVKELEKDPPKNLEDWPDDDAKYVTFGGPEGDHGYEEGPEPKLGPSGLRHHEDGSVSIDGEKVDNPDDTRATRSRAAPPTRLTLQTKRKGLLAPAVLPATSVSDTVRVTRSLPLRLSSARSLRLSRITSFSGLLPLVASSPDASLRFVPVASRSVAVPAAASPAGRASPCSGPCDRRGWRT